MKRATHLALGAAVALPIAVSHPPLVAVGCIWFGMTGGGLPDWFDLRSDLRRPLRLRHRGISHSIVFLLFAVAVLWVVLPLPGEPFPALAPDHSSRVAWSSCMALGILSHLVSDSCTHAGIQPLLPFSRMQMWVLPRPLRTRYDGLLDRLLWWGAVIAIGFGLVVYLGR